MKIVNLRNQKTNPILIQTDIKQKPKANKKNHFKEDEEFNEGSDFETNSDLSSEDEKEKIQENFQNVEHENENENEQPDILEIENSENSDDCDSTE